MGMPTPHILVIDDDLPTREALADILRRAGFVVSTWAGDSRLEGVSAGQGYQAAVVDYHLPSQNGLEVARRLKELQPQCRVLLISAELPGMGELTGASQVVDLFLAKPFSKEVFLEAVGQLCLTPKP